MPERTLKTLFLLILVAVVALSCSQSGKTSADRVARGDEAPTFILPTLDGKEEVVAAKVIHNAHATVLIFWSMACPSCTEALVTCQQVYEEYADQGTAFFGINFDIENTQGVRAFLKGENITIPHLWDRGQRTTKAYKTLDYTFSYFVIDRQGIIVDVQYDHPPNLAEELSKTIEKTLPRGGNK